MVDQSSDVEREIRALAHQLAAASTPSWPERVRNRTSANAVAMAWATRRAELKTHLFRFVDVVPACTSAAEVTAHLREELDQPWSPAAVRWGLHLAGAVPGGDAVAAAVARSGIRQMARQFIIGEQIDDVVDQLGERWVAGFASTVDLLGEKTLTQADGDAYATKVAASLDALVAAAATWPSRPVLEQDPFGPLGRVNLSIKPSALAPRMHVLTEALGVAEAVERLAPILDRARAAGATIHLDAEHDETKDATHALLAEIGRRWPDGPALGCVVQAYRRDAAGDLEHLVRWSADHLATPLQVRLVKGAYWDAETIAARAHGWASPLFEVKSASDANYELCAAELAAGAARGAVRPAFASHNLRSIAAAVVACRREGLDDSAFEVQVLHGMAEPLHHGLRDSGFRTRVYSPMGELIPGMGYLVRRLLENTANESFVRQQWTDGADLDASLAAPASAPAAPADTSVPDPAHPSQEDTVSVTASFRNAPLAELRRAPVRRRLAAAVADVEAELGFEVPVLIDGERAAGLGGDPMVSVDPGRIDRVVAVQSLASREQAADAVAVAHGALGTWGATPVAERARILLAAADLLRRRQDEVAALIAIEAGKPLAEADADVGEALDFWTYYAAAAVALDATGLAQVPGERNDLRWRPRGVTAVISPWNFPLAIPAGMVGAALVTGNPVVFKPAEQTPGVALRMVEILHRAGVPAAALALLPGLGEVVGPVLVEHPLVATIAFTGSRAVGLDIVRRAGATPDGQRLVKRVSAEMGGKNPVIVDLDADLDVTVPALVSGAFGYAGQKCSATSRVLVPRRLVDQLADRLAGAVEVLTVGHPTDPGNAVGPVIDAESLDRVRRYQAVAADEGRVVVQRQDLPDGGWYAGPTVAIVDRHAKVATEEIFGPVLAIVPVADFDEALEAANDSDYALTAGVFSRTPSHIDEAARRLEAGNVYVNRATTGAMVARQPFGGHRLSGSGAKTGGPGYLEQFATPVVVTENTQRQGFAPDL
ncbi:proline dehydrogenase family protein [soil metagenome]